MKRNLFAVISLVVLLAFFSSASAAPYAGADIEIDGVNYDDASARWIAVGSSVATGWDEEWLEFSDDLTTGDWDIGLNAINYSPKGLIPSYTDFLVGYSFYSIIGAVETELATGTLSITASDIEIFYDTFSYAITSDGTYGVRYTWLNDGSGTSPEWDANIRVTSAFFDDVTAVPLPSAIIVLASGLAGLIGIRRR